MRSVDASRPRSARWRARGAKALPSLALPLLESFEEPRVVQQNCRTNHRHRMKMSGETEAVTHRRRRASAYGTRRTKLRAAMCGRSSMRHPLYTKDAPLRSPSPHQCVARQERTRGRWEDPSSWLAQMRSPVREWVLTKARRAHPGGSLDAAPHTTATEQCQPLVALSS